MPIVYFPRPWLLFLRTIRVFESDKPSGLLVSSCRVSRLCVLRKRCIDVDYSCDFLTLTMWQTRLARIPFWVRVLIVVLVSRAPLSVSKSTSPPSEVSPEAMPEGGGETPRLAARSPRSVMEPPLHEPWRLRGATIASPLLFGLLPFRRAPLLSFHSRYINSSRYKFPFFSAPFYWNSQFERG